MTAAEIDILREFRRYSVAAHSMLFFNCSRTNPHSPQFKRAIISLLDQGLIARERRDNAYSLTRAGYSASLSI